jgi:hypothetical protein
VFPIEETVRYWIYWNDLVQGPFEVDELTSLRAFTDDLPVCMEDRQEWVPSARVADLAPAVELWRARRQAPLAPPPPPPSAPPSTHALQGEFFIESPGQQSLFNGNESSDGGPKGPFAFYPVEEASEAASPIATLPPAVTNPIHFGPSIVYTIRTNTAIKERPAPAPRREKLLPAEPIAPLSAFFPDSATIEPPPVEKKPGPIVLRELPVEEKPAIIFPFNVPAPIAAQALPEDETLPEFTSVLPSLDEPVVPTSKSTLWPWIGGVMAVIVLGLMLLYWRMDRATSSSAISEATRHVIAKPFSVGVSKAPPPVVVLAPPPPKASKPVAAARHHHSLTAIMRKSQQWIKTAKAPIVPKAEIAPAVAVPAPKELAVVPALPAPSVDVPKPVVPALPGLQQTPLVAKPISAPAKAPASPTPADPWAARQTDAINSVMAHPIAGGKQTVGGLAKMMLEEMHEKELMHAADTGERLYLPDKIAWSALREEGPVYRVYLNFSALQANGERVQTRSYQFETDLQKKAVSSDETPTQQDFLNVTTIPKHVHQPMADDIDSLLSGVDLLNKHKLRAMIISKKHSTKLERKNMASALGAAQQRVERAILYFRTRYPEKALQNVAKAYEFIPVLNGGK